MDAERLAFLYGPGIDENEWDLGDVEVRALLLERSFTEGLSAEQLLGREIVANQVFADDPPEVWATVKRMLDAGRQREDVFGQLTLAFAPVMMGALERDEPFDREAYARALTRLPLPSAEDIEAAIVDVVRADQGIVADELERRVFDHLGRDPDDETVDDLVGRVMDRVVDQWGPLAWVAGDRTIHVEDLTARIMLTHRLSEAERGVGALSAAFDLAGFARRDDLALPGGDPVAVFSVERGHLGWMGPDGWLDGFPVGTLLVVQVDADGVVHLGELEDEPAVNDALVERVWAAYDREVDEPWLPVSGEDLVLALLLEDRDTFDEPRAPLADLCAAAGLERRQDQVAHDDTVWHAETRTRRTWRVMDKLGDDKATARKVLRALDVADVVFGVDPAAVPDLEGDIDDGMLRAVLDELADEDALSGVAVELFDRDDPDARPRAEAFVDALLAAASRPREQAVARVLAAARAERSLQPLVAEQHLALAHEADAGFAVAIDRLAWYASDRGDAARAARLWRRLDRDRVIDQDLREVAQFESSAHTKLGRNEPCWCGSGRKYKQCHLGSTELAPLPERVGWLCRKAVGFVERRGGSAQADVLEIACARAVDPDERHSVLAAFEDPIVMDLAVTEGGWFERFLEERGELLPDDEEMLARAWLLVDRTVYEVVDVHAGRGVRLRDLRTGDQLDVRERTFSRETGPGALVCARAVPDGETHQLVGGFFPVAPGSERRVLELLDSGDPVVIADYVSGLYRPPVLQTREGEPLVQCELTLEVGDPTAARAFLDRTYESDDREGWVELYSLDDDEEILRASLHLDGSRLSVGTMSEQRADRVLDAIRGSLTGTRVLSDRRTRTDVSSLMKHQERQRARLPVADTLDPNVPETAALFEQMRDRFEQRWCEESVPALAGLTPRQAAADPSRRGELERLIASFDDHRAPANAVAMRPQRLRQLLGL